MNTSHRPRTKTGYLFVVLAALLFAVSGTASKFLFNSGLTPFQLIQLRTTLAAIGLFVWLLLTNRPLLRISVKDLPYFAALGVFGIGSAQFFYLFAISKINVAAAILLHYTGPVFVALYAGFVLKQKIGLIGLISICGSIIGCFLAVGAYHPEVLTINRIGIATGLLAAIAFAIYSILSDTGMKKYSPYTVLFFGLLFASLMWNILHPPLESVFQPYSRIQWGWIFFIGLCGTILPFGLYFEGIRRIKPTHASITATLEPISAGVIAAVFLGELLAPLQIIGGFLVVISILILQYKTPEK